MDRRNRCRVDSLGMFGPSNACCHQDATSQNHLPCLFFSTAEKYLSPPAYHLPPPGPGKYLPTFAGLSASPSCSSTQPPFGGRYFSISGMKGMPPPACAPLFFVSGGGGRVEDTRGDSHADRRGAVEAGPGEDQHPALRKIHVPARASLVT